MFDLETLSLAGWGSVGIRSYRGHAALGIWMVPVTAGIAAAGIFAWGRIGRLQMSLTLINVTPKSAASALCFVQKTVET